MTPKKNEYNSILIINKVFSTNFEKISLSASSTELYFITLKSNANSTIKKLQMQNLTYNGIKNMDTFFGLVIFLTKKKSFINIQILGRRTSIFIFHWLRIKTKEKETLFPNFALIIFSRSNMHLDTKQHSVNTIEDLRHKQLNQHIFHLQ